MEKKKCKRSSFESNSSIETESSFSQNSETFIREKRRYKSVTFSHDIDIVSIDNYKHINRKLSLPAYVIYENYKQVKLENIQNQQNKKRNHLKDDFQIKIHKRNASEDFSSQHHDNCFVCSIF